MHLIRIYQIMIVEEYLNMAYYYIIQLEKQSIAPNTSIGRRQASLKKLLRHVIL